MPDFRSMLEAALRGDMHQPLPSGSPPGDGAPYTSRSTRSLGGFSELWSASEVRLPWILCLCTGIVHLYIHITFGFLFTASGFPTFLNTLEAVRRVTIRVQKVQKVNMSNVIHRRRTRRCAARGGPAVGRRRPHRPAHRSCSAPAVVLPPPPRARAAPRQTQDVPMRLLWRRMRQTRLQQPRLMVPAAAVLWRLIRRRGRLCEQLIEGRGKQNLSWLLVQIASLHLRKERRR